MRGLQTQDGDVAHGAVLRLGCLSIRDTLGREVTFRGRMCLYDMEDDSRTRHPTGRIVHVSQMPPEIAMAEPLPVHPLTVDDYHAMAEAGILTEDSRVELIDGQLIDKMTIGPRHLRVVNVLNKIAVLQASHVVEVSIQNPVILGRYSEPEPDVVLLRGDRDQSKVPSVGDVLLLVEVADTTLRLDKRVKLPLYAAAGIPEVWIVNLVDEVLERYTDPSESGFKSTVFLGRHDSVEAGQVPELGSIPVSSILGEPSGSE